MKHPLSLLTLATIASQFVTSAHADRWDENNNPALFGSGYVYKFSPEPDKNPGSLPLQGMLPPEKMTWSDSYWPRNKGSINYNWNTPHPDGFNPGFPNVRAMSPQQLAAILPTLPPAQKADLAMGNYDYPISSFIYKNRKNDKTAKSFEGVCDGWTIASMQFEEPKPAVFTNPDGMAIPFGSTDLKALISYDLSLNHEDKDFENVFVGSYCATGAMGQKMKSAACTDLNPGAFHVVLANEIGLRQQTFAADVEAGKETWNQPVFGFEFKVIGSAVSKKAPKAYRIHGRMMFNEDDPLDGPMDPRIFSWNPTNGTAGFATEVLEVDYILELDYADRIIGGSWELDSYYKHPDLFWKTMNKVPFSDDFAFLNKLVKRRDSKTEATEEGNR